MEESWESQEAALSFLSELTHSFSNYLRIQMKRFFFSFSLSQTPCELYIVRISVNSDCRVVKATESSVVKMVASNMCCFWSYAISFTCVKLAQQFNNLKVFLSYPGRLNSQSPFLNDECHSQRLFHQLFLWCLDFLSGERGFYKQKNFIEQIFTSSDDPCAHQCSPTQCKVMCL